MKVLDLEKNPFNIQKCLLPDCEFLRKNYGQYCVVSLNRLKCIVRIGLFDVKNVEETLFLDESVMVVSSLEDVNRDKCVNNLNFDDFSMIGKPTTAKTVDVTVVFSNVLDIKRYRNCQKFEEIVKDILKLFVVSSNSIVSLTSLSQNIGINCLIIENVNNSESNKIVTIDLNTKINLLNCISQLKYEQSQQRENLLQIGGCSRVYSIIKETLDFVKCCNQTSVKFANKLLLLGPPGCGKTTLMQNVVRDCGCILLDISAININSLAGEDMEKKLRSVFEEAKVYAEFKECCVILIEDIDQMSSGKTFHAKRFVGVLISLLEDIENTPGIVVVATTNSPDEVDSQLRRPKRLEDELEIMIPTEEERVEILNKILTHCKIYCEVETLRQISHWTPGFVGADLRLLVLEAFMVYRKKRCTGTIDQKLLKNCFKKAFTKVIPSSLRGAVGLCTSNTMTFSQIGGLEEIKKILDLSVKEQLENPEKFRRFGIPLTKGILLYGPPGCAKTTLVKALAKECNTTFLATSAADIYSPFVGDAEKKIALLFTQARIGSPSILFIDEIDAVVGSKSGDRDRGVQERVLSTLLIEMDGIGVKVNTQRDNSLNILSQEKAENYRGESQNVIVIGATNRPQLLDDALKRPGRFDRLLYVPPPDELERYRILKKLTGKMPLHESVDLNLLASLTNFYSGADLKNLCQEAGLHALRSTEMTAESIRQSDFEHVLNEYKPSLNEKVVQFYESFQKCNI